MALDIFVGHSVERGGWCVYVQTDPGEYEVLRGPFGNQAEAEAALRSPALQRLREEILTAVKKEREECAKLADKMAKRDFNWASENADIYHAQADWAERLAVLIRQRGKNTT